MTSVSIPHKVTTIGDEAFGGCSVPNSVAIPNSVTSIGNYAFAACHGLTSVTIPNSVTSIEDYTFYRCTGLVSVTIGNSVMSIGNNAFSKCDALTDVYCYAEQVPETGGAVFSSMYYETKITLHVPAASIDAYSNAYPWKSFGSIVALTDSDPKPTGITVPTATQQTNIAEHYDLNGHRVSQPQRGLNIVKMSDGTMKKVIVK